ncbi:MAG: hypothetical protein AB8G86_10115 [Saprospiraceae bacterium]
MNTIKTILFIGILALINFSFSSEKNTKINNTNLALIETFSQELCATYDTGQNLMLMDKNGTQILNPNKADLQNLAPELFNQNRVRVTLAGSSDNNLCSTELVIMDQSGKIEGNYTVNSCSSYGWIFFTESNCFQVALFHDAGLEAPYGSSINGSVDWTFKYNDQSKLRGTYMDMGAANMFNVATPCYNNKKAQPMTANEARKRIERRNSIITAGS